MGTSVLLSYLGDWTEVCKSRNSSKSKFVYTKDCYFCNTTLIKGFNAKNKQQIVYADVTSVAQPVFIHVPKAENTLGVTEK